MIYLDYTANTPADPRVLARFCEVESRFFGNANAHHAAGRAAAAEMDRVTARIAALLGVGVGELLYTSGATEANNLAVRGLAQAGQATGRHIVSTPLEHASVRACLDALQAQGWEVELAAVGRDGRVDPDDLARRLRPDTTLVAVTAVDSELGAIQPVAAIAQTVSRFPNCHLHVDATQAIGKLPFSFAGIDTVSFTAHKFGGLNGCGMLVRGQDVVLEPLIHGGHSTTLYRSGTPALALAASMETALELALDGLEARLERVTRLNRLLRDGLRANPAVTINSPEDASPYILNLSVEGFRGAQLRDRLDERGFCVSVKSACSVENTPSRAVMAIARNRRRALSAFRVSLSHQTTEEELHAFLNTLDQLCKENPSCRAR